MKLKDVLTVLDRNTSVEVVLYPAKLNLSVRCRVTDLVINEAYKPLLESGIESMGVECTTLKIVLNGAAQWQI